MTTPILFGIANCDTIKKARLWFDDHSISYEFHDYRKHGLEREQLQRFEAELGWEALLNRRGTTWRKLPEALRDSIDREKAIDVMLANPAIIKRPLLQKDETLLLGFDPANYETVLSENE
ncbi:MAG: arsenate reductase [Planctomycetota bacterium]|jgi:arsenate reductase